MTILTHKGHLGIGSDTIVSFQVASYDNGNRHSQHNIAANNDTFNAAFVPGLLGGLPTWNTGDAIWLVKKDGVTPGNMGLLRELHVITAVVIGGTSLSGGRATMLGTLLGALIFGTLSNGMNLLNLNSNWQLILTGLILLGASTLDSWSTRHEAQR